jgi:hypothetical protein
MFSRTTMASSISRPTHRLSAISVIMLMVKPNRFMNRKVPISAIGSVSPVMTVERHEFRNRNTISTVSSAPSISVRRTLSTATRMGREPSVMGSSRTPGGSWACSSASGLQAVDHLDGVFVLRLLHRQQQGALAVVQRQAVTSCAPSFTVATWSTRTGCAVADAACGPR